MIGAVKLAVKLAVETGHARGIRVALDCEPHADPVARDMGGEFPEAMGSRLAAVRGKVVDGTFRLRLLSPHTEAKQPIYGGVEAAFLRRGAAFEKIAPFPFDLTSEISVYKGNVAYLTDLDPRLRLLEQLQGWIASEVECHSDNILWRLYRRDGRAILVCIARKDRQMSGILRFAKHQIEIKRGTVAFIEETDGKPALHGEDLEATCQPI